MRVLSKSFGALAGFAILIVVLIAAISVTRHQFGIQLENGHWVRHTQQVLLELSECESLLRDAETGQRGFLYTKKPEYLAPYETARKEVDAHFGALAQLTADNPRQQSTIVQLRSLAHQKLDELAQTIAFERAGRDDAARALVDSDRGLDLMGQIHAIMTQMRAEEDSLAAVRNARYRRSIQITMISLYGTGATAIAGLLLLAYAIRRGIKSRERHLLEVHSREEWFRITLTSIGDAVIATDRDGKVTFLNPIAEKLTGSTWDEVVGRDIQDVFPIFNEFTRAKADNPVAKVIALGKVVGLANHTVLKHRDGHLIPIEDSAAPICDDHNQLIGVVLVFRDVTNERKSQELLRRSEKLSAAARLSATVAHEINNPLEAVTNLIFLAKLTEGLPKEVADQLTLAEQELARVAHITRQTLGFYRESHLPQPMDIAPVLESVLSLYSNKLRAKDITVRCEFASCPPVHAVTGELRQAISNLLSNAVDAVQPHGHIDLTLQCQEESEEKLVELHIEDDGPGVPEQDRERIFEPFFTTKKNIGTGLGLYVTKEILERHGGSIELRSRANGNGGARFVLRLPCDPDPNAQESVIAPA